MRNPFNVRMKALAVLLSAVLAAVAATLAGITPAQGAVRYGEMGNYHSGKCLDMRRGSKNNGTQVIQYTCHGSANQNWRMYHVATLGNGWWLYDIENENSHKCLSNKGNSDTPGTPVIQWPCNRADKAEQWAPEHAKGPYGLSLLMSYGSISSPGVRKVLHMHVDLASQANGVPVSINELRPGSTNDDFFWSLPPGVTVING